MKTMTWAMAGMVMAGRMVAPMAAESTNAPPATVAGLVQEACAKNPELKFYEAELQAAKAGVKAAGLWGNPELSGILARKEMRASDMSAEGVAWSVSLMQPFEWPGCLGLRKAIANRDVQPCRTRDRTLQNRACLPRARACLHCLCRAAKGRRRRAGSRRPLQTPPGYPRSARSRGHHSVTRNTVIEATEVTMQRKAADATVQMQAALLELNQIRGVEPAEERAGDRERMIGVGISAPLPLWNWNKPAIETAQACQLQAETSLLVTRREVDRKVAQAVVTDQRMLRSVASWRPDSAEHFRQAADLADRHYRLGAVPIATYMTFNRTISKSSKPSSTLKRKPSKQRPTWSCSPACPNRSCN